MNSNLSIEDVIFELVELGHEVQKDDLSDRLSKEAKEYFVNRSKVFAGLLSRLNRRKKDLAFRKERTQSVDNPFETTLIIMDYDEAGKFPSTDQNDIMRRTRGLSSIQFTERTSKDTARVSGLRFRESRSKWNLVERKQTVGEQDITVKLNKILAKEKLRIMKWLEKATKRRYTEDDDDIRETIMRVNEMKVRFIQHYQDHIKFKITINSKSCFDLQSIKFEISLVANEKFAQDFIEKCLPQLKLIKLSNNPSIIQKQDIPMPVSITSHHNRMISKVDAPVGYGNFRTESNINGGKASRNVMIRPKTSPYMNIHNSKISTSSSKKPNINNKTFYL